MLLCIFLFISHQYKYIKLVCTSILSITIFWKAAQKNFDESKVEDRQKINNWIANTSGSNYVYGVQVFMNILAPISLLCNT